MNSKVQKGSQELFNNHHSYREKFRILENYVDSLNQFNDIPNDNSQYSVNDYDLQGLFGEDFQCVHSTHNDKNTINSSSNVNIAGSINSFSINVSEVRGAISRTRLFKNQFFLNQKWIVYILM